MLPGRLRIARWMATSCLIGAVAGTAILPGSASAIAQDTVTPSAPPPQPAVPPEVAFPAPTFTQAQIDAMVAPIALYPDQLLGEMLMAAAYPQEIAEADRWVDDPAAASLRGDDLAAALAPIDWDPSVKSLVAFPQILDLMAQHLDWTQGLGTAFLAQQGQVMDAVQRLRREALAAGVLRSTPQLTVISEGGTIVIEPASPGMLYVPVYDPTVIYGPWPYPQPPVELYPPEAYDEPIVFSTGFVIVRSFWGWSRCDWSHHRMFVDPRRVNAINARLIAREHRPRVEATTWRVDPSRRHGGSAPGTASAVVPQRQPTQPGSPHSAPSALHPRQPPQETPSVNRHHSLARAPQLPAAVAPPHASASPVPSNTHQQVERPHPSSPPPMPSPAIAAAPHVEAHPGPAPHASPAPGPVPPPPRISIPHPAIAAVPHVDAPRPEARPHIEAHPAPAPHASPAPAPVAPLRMSMPHPAIAAVPHVDAPRPHIEAHPGPAPHASPAPAPAHMAPQVAHGAPRGAPDHKHP